MLSIPALDELLDRLNDRTVLVIGDLMVDQFVIGTVDRISPEAPVPIVRFPEHSFFSTMREKLHWGGLQDRDEPTRC